MTPVRVSVRNIRLVLGLEDFRLLPLHRGLQIEAVLEVLGELIVTQGRRSRLDTHNHLLFARLGVTAGLEISFLTLRGRLLEGIHVPALPLQLLKRSFLNWVHFMHSLSIELRPEGPSFVLIIPTLLKNGSSPARLLWGQNGLPGFP